MRPSWDDYFMAMAYLAATRATCDRKHVGCVIVDQARHVVATGYNGSPPGKPHCDDAGHEIVDGHCVRTVHAESNAIAQAAKNGRSLYGTTCYSTTIPCYDCAKLLLSAGIHKVVFAEFYQSRYDFSDRVSSFFIDGGVNIHHLLHPDLKVIIDLIQFPEGSDARDEKEGEVQARSSAGNGGSDPLDDQRASCPLPGPSRGPNRGA